MESTLVLPPATQARELEFPILARATNSELVVLFNAVGSGTVMVPDENRGEELGEWSSNWSLVTDTHRWEILPKGTKVIITV